MFKPDPHKSSVAELPPARTVLIDGQAESVIVFERQLSRHDQARIQELWDAQLKERGENR